MKFVMSTLAALGLMAAPAFAQTVILPPNTADAASGTAAQASDDNNALAAVPVLGVPAGILALGGVVVVAGAVAIAASNSSSGTN